MSAPRIRRRNAGDPAALPTELHPLLRRVYASRGVRADQLSLELRQLLSPEGMKGMDVASARVVQAIARDECIIMAGDYDADGATGCALGVLGLRALGAKRVSYVVPDRFRMGYGLSPALADLAAEQGAQLLITVDNGIASHAGVAHARTRGLEVIITDHHLPGETLPDAQALINPNQPGCTFASKALAGVGVMFYLLLAVRARLRAQGAFAEGREPNLADWLDLVALGSVADVVPLDYNNRILIEQGLRRIRAGRARPGIHALLEVAGREATRLTATDLGFVLGPRINAAGRLEDIRTGIECLLAPDLETARPLARALDQYNRERREIEAQMRDEAYALIEHSAATGVCVFDESWHEGVVGLVAARVKERLHRPTFAFARAQEAGQLKGSGRSIPGLHLRDALAAVEARAPGLIGRFGGHAMAAGLTLREDAFADFSAAFDAICREWLSADTLNRVLDSDGDLRADELNVEAARALEQAGPWGQGFAEPLFEGAFEVLEARAVGAQKNHIRYRLRLADGRSLTAMDFNGAERLIPRGCGHALYRMALNRYQGNESLDLHLVEWSAA